MISEFFIEDLIRLLEVELKAFGRINIPIFIFMGDYRQLTPVDSLKSQGIISGALFSNENLKDGKVFELTDVMRTKSKFFHKIFDSVGNQIEKMRDAIQNDETPETFNFKPYDILTSKSTEDMLIVPNTKTVNVINYYVRELANSNNPYNIFWTHYNNTFNPKTEELVRSIRGKYFKEVGLDPELVNEKVKIGQKSNGEPILKPKIYATDYVEFTGTLKLNVPGSQFKDKYYDQNIIYPKSRFKILDESIEEATIKQVFPKLINLLSPYLGLNFNWDDYTVKVKRLLLSNRYDEEMIHSIIQSKLSEILKVEYFEKEERGYTKKYQKLSLTNLKTKEIKEILIPYETYKRNADIFDLIKKSNKTLIEDYYQLSYVGSTHTVQGNSISKIIVGDYNIRSNASKIDNRDLASSLYVALTRVKDKLIIIKPDDPGVISKNNDTSVYRPDVVEPVKSNEENTEDLLLSEDSVLDGLRNDSPKLDPVLQRRIDAVRKVITFTNDLIESDPKYKKKAQNILKDVRMMGESDGFIGSRVPETAGNYVSATELYQNAWGAGANKNFAGMRSVMISGSGTWNPSSKGGNITLKNIEDHFVKFYQPLLQKAIDQGVKEFHVGEAQGIDALVRKYFEQKGFSSIKKNGYDTYQVAPADFSNDNKNQPFVEVESMTISPSIKNMIDTAVQTIADYIAEGREVVIPAQGIGQYLIGADPKTGELNKNAKPVAPETFKYLSEKLSELGIQNNNFNKASGISTEEILKQQKVVTDEEVIEAMMCLFGIGK
jgi:hypothetical protein